jgi:hypothetical protein
MKPFRLALPLVLILGFSPIPARSQSFDPKSPKTEFEQAVGVVIGERGTPRLPTEAETEPPLAPSSKQTQPSAATGASPGVVNLADASSLLSTAMDRLIGDQSNDALTVSLDMFAFVAANQPSIAYDLARYNHYKGLRRWSGSVTLGGLPEASSDSGVALPAVHNVTDIWGGNARWRFYGSRDRRENWRRYIGLRPKSNRAEELVRKAAIDLAEPLGRAESAEGRFDVYLGYLRAHPDVAEAVYEDVRKVTKGVTAVNEDIDHNLLLTLGVSGEFRKPEFGRDNLLLELIAEGGHSVDVTGNLRYRYNEQEDGRQDQEVILALGLAKQVLRGIPSLPQGVDLALGVSGEVGNNDRQTIWKVNGKLDVPVQLGLRLTASITWANRQVLIDEETVHSHFGLSYDLSAWQPGGDAVLEE